MKNLFNPANATFDHPIAMLTACHERVRSFANLLIKLSEHLQQHGTDEQAIQAATSILRYFDIAAPLHHQDEDEDLYPALLRHADTDLTGVITAIQSEHPVLDAQWQSIKQVLHIVSQGKAATLNQAEILRFAQQYIQHTHREERDIYSHAPLLLNNKELQEPGKRMAARRGG